MSLSPFFPLPTRPSGVWDEATTGRWLDNLRGRVVRTVINVLDSGAAGNGTDDDANAFASALSSLTAGDVLWIPGGRTYKLVGNWTLSKAMTVMAHGATLNFSTDSTNQGVKITASNVKWYGCTITGPQSASQSSTQIGISADGTVSAYLEGVKIQGVKISGFGYSGIKLAFCEEFEVSGWNEIYDCYDAGVYALSCKKGKINGNYIHDIDADGSVGTASYGIAVTKNNGTEAAQPVCHSIEVNDNLIYNCPVWEGLDTHGGNRISFCNNIVVDCRQGIVAAPYAATAGSERGATNCVISGNIVVNTGAIAATDARQGINVTGDSTAGTPIRSTGCVVTGNTIDGYGDSNASIDTLGALHLEYADACILIGNVIRNSGRHAIAIFGSSDFVCADNVVDTVSGTASVAATGTITFAANPTAGADTITINGRIFSFVAGAPANNYEIQVAATLPLTLDNMIAALNGNGSKDGRVWLATYTENGVDVLTITHDIIGTSGNNFTIAASAATASGATLSGGAAGSCGITIHNLSGGITCTGVVRNNTLAVGSYTGIQMTDNNTGTHLQNNRHMSTGPLYDMKGGGSTIQAGAGDIIGLPMVRATYDSPSINAAASGTFYIPCPGIGAEAAWSIRVNGNRVMDGLVLSARCGVNNVVEVQLFNPSAGAVDLGSTTFTVTADRCVAAAVDLGP